jgi:dipeptidyl-peptidase-3
MEIVDDMGVLQLSADVFVDLQPRDRMLAYWLSQAAVAGDPITYDQRSRYGRPIKTLVDGMMQRLDAIDAPVRPKVELFAKRVWINKGIYDARTSNKLPTPMTSEELAAAAKAAFRAGAKFDGIASESALDAVLASLQRVLFDPGFEPFTVAKNPPQGQDPITASAATYYEGVTLQDLTGYSEKHPLNSRIVKKGPRLVEEVYRITPRGLYAPELEKMVEALQHALPLAGDKQRASLEHLIRYFQSGEPGEFTKYNKAWVKDDPSVDAVLGFIETYGDPRGVHGEFEGAVFTPDPKRTALMKKLASEAPYFERRMPWADAYKRAEFTAPVANAVVPLTMTGGAGPISPAGINLPNDQAIRQTDGSKNFFLTTINDAVSDVYTRALVSSFTSDPAMAAEIRRCAPSVREAKVMLHEITGHGSGRVSPALQQDPKAALRDVGAALEEARADLVALFVSWDPKVIELGLLPDAGCAQMMAQTYPAQFLFRFRAPGETIENDHLRAGSLIVRYAIEKGAVREVVRDGDVYLPVVDYDLWRKAVGELLAEVMRIKAEGDYAKGRELIDRYATKVDPAWRDSSIRRARSLGTPSRFAFISPRIKPLRDDKGELMDATIVDSLTLTQTALVDAGKMELP